MRIILTEDVVGLGDIGETVSVRPGFARNYLIPRGFAIETEARSGKSVAHHMRQIDAKKRKLKSAAEQLGQRVRDLTLEFQLRVGQRGKVFGSVSSKDIAERLSEAGVVTDRRRVQLSEPLRKVGTHFVKLKLHADVFAQVKVNIESIEASPEDEAAETKEAREMIEENAPDVAEEGAEVSSEEAETAPKKKRAKKEKAGSPE